MHLQPLITHCVGSWEPLCILFLDPHPSVPRQPTSGLSQGVFHLYNDSTTEAVKDGTHTPHPSLYLNQSSHKYTIKLINTQCSNNMQHEQLAMIKTCTASINACCKNLENNKQDDCTCHNGSVMFPIAKSASFYTAYSAERMLFSIKMRHCKHLIVILIKWQ